MFGGWLDKSRWPIGLEIASHALRAVQLAWDDRKWKVLSAATAPFPAEMPTDETERQATLQRLLEQLLSAGEFQGNQVVSCLPPSAMQYKNLRLPPMPANELNKAVQWEATDRLKFDSQYQIQHFDAGEVRQGEETRREILLLAAPVRAIEQHVTMLQSAGLEPVAIDAAPAALARWAAAMDPDPEATQCVLSIDTDVSNVLIARQGRVLFFKPIELGTLQVDEAIATHLSLSLIDARDLRRTRASAISGSATEGGPDQQHISRAIGDALRGPLMELSREIGLCLRYYGVTFRGRRPEDLQIVGELANEPLLAELLPSAAGLAVATDVSRDYIDWPQSLEDAARQAPQLALAAGLSMRSKDTAANKGAA
ncbi:MAG: pilus assembly protein PilM [Phycisphaeraceae bacterium]